MAKRRTRRRSSRHRRSRYNRGGRRRSRRRKRRRRRKQRGGGYGFSQKELPNYGKRSINWVRTPNSCKNIQRGGGLDSKDLGHSLGGGGKISYGYDGSKFSNDLRGSYAPISRSVRPQCGAGKRRSRRRRSRRRRRRRRRQRGGYHQYQSNKPFTSGLSVAGVGGDWKLANPPSFKRTNNCRNNYNHFKRSGSPSPVLDQAAVY